MQLRPSTTHTRPQSLWDITSLTGSYPQTTTSSCVMTTRCKIKKRKKPPVCFASRLINSIGSKVETHVNEGLGLAPAQRTEGSLPRRLLKRLKVLFPVESDEPLFDRLVGQFWRRFDPHRIRSATLKRRRRRKAEPVNHKVFGLGLFGARLMGSADGHKKKKKRNLRVQFLDAERVEDGGQ